MNNLIYLPRADLDLSRKQNSEQAPIPIMDSGLKSFNQFLLHHSIQKLITTQ